MIRPSLLALAFLATATSSLHADLIVREAEIVVDASTQSASLSLPRFPSSLGTLLFADLVLETRLTGRVEYENTASLPGEFVVRASRRVELSRPNPSAPLVAEPVTRVQDVLEAFDGTLDGAGASGRTVGGFDSTDGDVVRIDGSELATWVGGGSLTLPLQVTDLHTATGTGALTTTFTTPMFVKVRVLYVYGPRSAVVRTLDTGTRTLPWTGFEFLDAFPPTTGELERIDLVVNARLSGTASFESQADGFGQVRVTHGGFLDLRLANLLLDQLLTGTIRVHGQYFVAAYDQLPDSAGVSGYSDPVVDRPMQVGAVTLDAPFLLHEFVSASPIGVIFEEVDTNFATGPAGVFYDAQDDVSVELTVVYHYDPSRERFCFGDGGVTAGCTPCPCLNDDFGAGARGGCMNSTGNGAELFATGASSVSADALQLALLDAPPGAFVVLISGDNRLPQSGTCPVGSGVLSAGLDGLRCVGGAVQRHGSRSVDANGEVGRSTPGWGPPNAPIGGLAAQGGFVAGSTRQFQAFVRDDPTGSPCSGTLNTTNGLSIAFRP